MNHRKHRSKISYLRKVLWGTILCFVLIILGIYGADFLGRLFIYLDLLPEQSTTPISGVFIAILFGFIFRTIFGIHPVFKQGIAFTLKYGLRIGIIFLGLRLSLLEALTVGAWVLPLVICTISIGLFVTLFFTKKMNQSSRLGTLIATGTGICGVTAIMAISPVIRAKENEVSYAVANITLFGLAGMMIYPFLAHFIFQGDAVKSGLFLGTSIHDTAQVTGAALIYRDIFELERVIDIATVTKLTRNLMMVLVIPLLSFFYYRNNIDSPCEVPKWYQFIPLFIVGFLLLSFLRTLGDLTVLRTGFAFGLLSEGSWRAIYETLSSFGATYLLGSAMAGVGLSTDLKVLKNIGLKPLYIGLIAALSVGILSVIFISFFGHLITAI